MKINFTDGYVVTPYIIWGELDQRGFVSVGFKSEEGFEGLEFLESLRGRAQYLRCHGEDYLFFCFALADFYPGGSLFNLNDIQITDRYEGLYDDTQTALCRLFYQIKHYTNQQIEPLQVKELAKLWQDFFNPLSFHHKFNPSKSILTNTIPKRRVQEKALGLELGSCLHHFITVKADENYFNLINTLDSYDLSAGISEGQCEQVYIHLYANSLKEIKERAFDLKSQLHELGKTDYYQANEVGENLLLLERSIPGGYMS